jgi:hypothetical protein
MEASTENSERSPASNPPFVTPLSIRERQNGAITIKTFAIHKVPIIRVTGTAAK